MLDEQICTSYVNIPSHLFIKLIERGFTTKSEQDPLNKKTICVRLDGDYPKYYIIAPDLGEAILETLEELDVLLMLKRLNNDNVLREYIKSTHCIHGEVEEAGHTHPN